MKYQIHLVLLAVFCLLVSSCSDDPATPDTELRVRKNVKELSATEKQNYVDAVLKMKQTVSPYNASYNYYDQFVYWHLQAFKCENGAAHMGPAFLPWHRQFLLMYERALNEVSPGKNILVPYW